MPIYAKAFESKPGIKYGETQYLVRAKCGECDWEQSFDTSSGAYRGKSYRDVRSAASTALRKHMDSKHRKRKQASN